jgi:hypothetical protein
MIEVIPTTAILYHLMSTSNPNLSEVYCVEPDWITEKPIVAKSESPSRNSILGVNIKSLSSSTISFTCLVGSMSLKYIHKRLSVISHIARSMMPSIPKNFASIPQSAGQTKKAVPNAAPISPIFLARVSFVEISEIYACTTPKPAPPVQDIRREKR